jgi:hypothetical protein
VSMPMAPETNTRNGARSNQGQGKTFMGMLPSDNPLRYSMQSLCELVGLNCEMYLCL